MGVTFLIFFFSLWLHYITALNVNHAVKSSAWMMSVGWLHIFESQWRYLPDGRLMRFHTCTGSNLSAWHLVSIPSSNMFNMYVPNCKSSAGWCIYIYMSRMSRWLLGSGLNSSRPHGIVAHAFHLVTHGQMCNDSQAEKPFPPFSAHQLDFCVCFVFCSIFFTQYQVTRLISSWVLMYAAMIGENRQLVTNEPVESEK